MTMMRPGTRVQLHPATDLWMRGARFGTVEKITKHSGGEIRRVHVRLDALDKVVRLKEELIFDYWETPETVARLSGHA